MALTERHILRCVLFCALLIGVLAGGGMSAAGPGSSAMPHGVSIESFQRTAGESIAWMRITVVSDTPVEPTWTVVSDVAKWDEFMSLFPKSETLERSGDGELVYLLVSPPWPIKDFTATVQTTKIPGTHLINWSVQKGKLTGNYGRMAVEGVEGGSRIIYESYGPAKNTFPNWAVKTGVYVVLPGILEQFYHRIHEGVAQEK